MGEEKSNPTEMPLISSNQDLILQGQWRPSAYELAEGRIITYLLKGKRPRMQASCIPTNMARNSASLMLSSCTQTLELAPQIPRAITIEKPHEGPTWITHSAGIKD